MVNYGSCYLVIDGSLTVAILKRRICQQVIEEIADIFERELIILHNNRRLEGYTKISQITKDGSNTLELMAITKTTEQNPLLLENERAGNVLRTARIILRKLDELTEEAEQGSERKEEIEIA